MSNAPFFEGTRVSAATNLMGLCNLGAAVVNSIVVDGARIEGEAAREWLRHRSAWQ
jgi:hypothetical protein